ncbi:MAG: HlyD family efflux transporter periplasmic adaptor subunit [Bacteroidota bacterium]
MENARESYEMELLDERSDQVKEILGKVPNWMIRWGITIVFVIVSIILIGASLISYNDVIPASIMVTSENPPVTLTSKSPGRLTKIFVDPGEALQPGDVIAVLESTVNFEDVLYLKERLQDFNIEEISSIEALETAYASSLNLGEMQLDYGSFLLNYQGYILNKTLAPDEQASTVIRRQLAEQRTFLRNQQQQLETYKKDLDLSKINQERNKTLYEKGVISKSEYENATRAFLQDQQQYEGFIANISTTQIAIANYNNQLTQTNISRTQTEINFVQEVENSVQNLKSSIDRWEQQFLIISPIAGRVTVFDIWNLYQNVEQGETLFTIIPEDTDKIIGLVTLPVRNSGKVKVGQKVVVKLDNYPFEEWGSLEGTIQNISEVPKKGMDTNYTLFIAIDGLETSFGKTIDFKQEMQGTAEIILEELSIMERIFYQLRKVFSRE